MSCVAQYSKYSLPRHRLPADEPTFAAVVQISLLECQSRRYIPATVKLPEQTREVAGCRRLSSLRIGC